MSSIMGPIGPEQLELFALELLKIAAFGSVYSLTSTNINCLLSNIYKYKLGHNVYEHKISDQFDYGSSDTRSVIVICH